MKQILCVRLTDWPIDRRRRQNSRGREGGRVGPSSIGAPLVFTRTVGLREIVVSASSEARAAGIRPGLTLAAARALCARLEHAPHEPQRDLRALEALARWMMRFTPIVAIGTRKPPKNEPDLWSEKDDVEPDETADPLSPAIFLDVSGCERVFGGMEKLIGKVGASLARMRVHASLALAPTPGGAWAAASCKPNDDAVPMIGPDQLARALGPLPPAALRIEPDVAATLHHLGIETIAQLIQMPRELLPARFGTMLLTRLDQALGRTAEPLVPLTYQAAIATAIDFDGVVDSLESLWMVLRRMLERLIAELERRDSGARRMTITFLRPHEPPVQKTIFLSRPSRDAQTLFNLVRCAMETIHQTQAAKKRWTRRAPAGADKILRREPCVREGFTGLRMEIPVFQRMPHEQARLLDQDEHVCQMELARLIERLRLRLGEESVMQAQLVESHIPERGYALTACDGELPGDGPLPAAGRLASFRPLMLLPSPVEVRAIVSPSHDRDGRPIGFTRDGVAHRLIHAVGPERIGGCWWEGHNKTRDYFDVEDDGGRRFWLFRVTQTGKWYLHGEFS